MAANPASALHSPPNARFYITAGAAKLLCARQVELVVRAPEISDEQVEKIVVDLAVRRGKRIADLDQQDFRSDPLRRSPAGEADREPAPADRAGAPVAHRQDRARGPGPQQHPLPAHRTAPRRPDAGVPPLLVGHVRDASNGHWFVSLTGGFTAVTRRFVQGHLAALRRYLDPAEFGALLGQGYFYPDNENGRQRGVWQYLDGVAAEDQQMRDQGAARRLLRNLIAVFGDAGRDQLRTRIGNLEEYFAARYPGQKDVPQVQQLKARCREWEAECLWGYFGWDCHSVRHLRLGFYTGEIFTEEPTVERDVIPVLDLLREVRPDVVSVAFETLRPAVQTRTTRCCRRSPRGSGGTRQSPAARV